MKKMFSMPQKYAISNTFQRQHAKGLIDQFKNKLKWDAKPNSSLIDIGCGSGDVTIDYVEPLLSKNYKKIVGVDISADSINFAKKTYEGEYPRAKFEVMDIATKESKFKEEFDHVTSFYCLNFVRDQSQAIKNIYNMLKPDGDVFLLIMARFHLYWILRLLEANPRFKPHMIEVSSYTSPYAYSETPAEDFTAVLKKAGFKDVSCKANRGYFIYEEDQMDKFLSMIDFLKPGTSEDIRNEFKKAFFDTLRELELVKEESDKNSFKIPYNNFIAYAKK